MKIGIVIVIYNQYINKSKAYNSIKNSKLNILIIDNSKEEYIIENELFSINEKLGYIAKGKNIGLSKAYNLAIEYFSNKNIDFLILSDDDSIITEEYLMNLEIFEFKKNKIYAPLIYNGKKLVNPHYHNDNYIKEQLKNSKFNNIKDLKKIQNTKYMHAINSGMIIPYSLLSEYRYDETLFLDCVDNNFCRSMFNMGIVIEIYPFEIIQSFSVMELKDVPLESLEHRIKIRLKDIKYYNKKTYIFNKTVIMLMYLKKTKNIKCLKYFI